MKVGIVTIYDLKNYGNRLQNYAVSEILRKIGIQSDTLIIDDNSAIETLKNKLRPIIGKKPRYHWNIIEEHPLYVCDYSPLEKKRYENFKNFSHKYINIKRVRLNKTLNNQYNFFIVGSDQVWNTDIGHGLSWEFLSFASSNKRISYAPSFGGSTVQNRVDEVSQYLKEFKSISVRESSGVYFIKRISGRNATHLIDPTLMLDSSEWRVISKKLENINLPKKYILTYFLGNTNNDVETKIQQIADNSGLPVIRLRDLTQPDIFVSGPSEFIYLINHALLVITDSFHGSVFSFIFEKPFMVFNREENLPNMMARVESLLEMFSLKRKYVNSGLPNNIWEHDYTEGYKQLEIEKNKAIDFLKKALQE